MEKSNMVQSYYQYTNLFEEKIPYNEVEDKITNLLETLNRSEVIIYLIKLLNELSISLKHNEKQSEIVTYLCPKNKISKINEYLNNDERTNIFFYGQILELLNFAIKIKAKSYQKEKALKNEKNRDSLLKSLLLSSDIWNKKTYISEDKANENYFNYAFSFRTAIDSSTTPNNMYYYLGRLLLLYKERFPTKIMNFREIFRESIGLEIDDYCNVITMILVFINYNNKFLNGYFSDDFIEHFNGKEFNRYLEKFSIKLEELNDSNNYLKTTTSYPIIRLQDGYLISDYKRFLSICIDAPIFKLDKKNHNWFSIYGEVIEDYTHSILFDIAEKKNICCKPKILYNDDSNKQLEIDDIIYDKNGNLGIIETKHAFINNAYLDISNPEKYLEYLNERYGVSKNSKKGIFQLARHVKNTLTCHMNRISNIQAIYPILIVNDDLISIPVTNLYLRNEYQKEFELMVQNGVRSQISNIVKIYPLIIISVRELEILKETFIRNNIEEILSKFYKFNNSGNETLYNFCSQNNDIDLYDNHKLAEVAQESLENAGNNLLPEVMKRIKKGR